MYVRTTGVGTDQWNILFHSGVAAYADAAESIRIKMDTGLFQYYDGSYHTISSYSNNVYYEVSLRDIDFVTNTYDIWVDGVKYINDGGFRNVQSEFTYFEIGTVSDNIVAYLDCFRVRKYHDVSPVWSAFGEEIGKDNPPVFSNLDPSDTETGVAVDVGGISIDINDPEGDTFNYTWACTDGSSNSASGNTNGTKFFMFDHGDLSICTLYTWWVNSSDEHGAWRNESYTFTTVCVNDPPVLVSVYPVNESVNVSIQYLRCWVNVSDADSEQYNISFGSNVSGEWVRFGYNNSLSFSVNSSHFLGNMTWYNKSSWWCYNVSDGSENWLNGTVWFTTGNCTGTGGSVNVYVPLVVDCSVLPLALVFGFLFAVVFGIVWRKRKT